MPSVNRRTRQERYGFGDIDLAICVKYDVQEPYGIRPRIAILGLQEVDSDIDDV